MRVTASSVTSTADAIRRAVAAVARQHDEIRGVLVLERIAESLPGPGEAHRVVIDVDVGPQVRRIQSARSSADRDDQAEAAGR